MSGCFLPINSHVIPRNKRLIFQPLVSFPILSSDKYPTLALRNPSGNGQPYLLPCSVMEEFFTSWATCFSYISLEIMWRMQWVGQGICFFFLCCGTTAALTQGVSSPSSNIPMVGASGAVSGVIGSYLLVYPRANIRVFYWFFIFVGTINLPAFLLLGFWVIEQFLALPESMKGAGGVAIAAHLGGFGFGILMTPVFKKRGVPLFQKGLTRSFARKSRRFRRK